MAISTLNIALSLPHNISFTIQNFKKCQKPMFFNLFIKSGSNCVGQMPPYKKFRWCRRLDINLEQKLRPIYSSFIPLPVHFVAEGTRYKFGATDPYTNLTMLNPNLNLDFELHIEGVSQ